MTDDAFKKLMVRITWGHVIVFLLVAVVATWIRGIGPEVFLGWIILILLIPLLLLTAYGVRQAYLGVGALFVALVLLGASFLHKNTWSVDQSQLLEWAIGVVAFAIWLFAWDARKQRTSLAVGNAAGFLVLLALLMYAALVAVYGSSVATGVKGLLGLAAVGGLYDLAGERWKIPLSIAAIVAIGTLLFKLSTEGLI